MRKRASTGQQKIDWLLEHQDKWEGIDTGSGMFYHPDQRERIERLATDIKSTGLYSENSKVQDVYLGLRKLIQKAREQRRLRAAGNPQKTR